MSLEIRRIYENQLSSRLCSIIEQIDVEMNNLTKASICGSIALKSSPAEALVSAVKGKFRQIVERTRGNLHGPITRLVSPGDLGQLMKPFIFLDAFHMPDTTGFKVCLNNNLII